MTTLRPMIQQLSLLCDSILQELDRLESEQNGAPPKETAPTKPLIDHWQDWERRSGVEPHGSYAHHAKVFRTLWTGCGKDEALSKKAVDLYRACRESFIVKNGHSIGEFSRTLSRWIALARGGPEIDGVVVRKTPDTYVPPPVNALDAAQAAAELAKLKSKARGFGSKGE